MLKKTGLVLTRKLGQSIQIGNDITVTLVRIKGKQARIMISAPQCIPIARCELLERKDVKEQFKDLVIQ